MGFIWWMKLILFQTHDTNESQSRVESGEELPLTEEDMHDREEHQ